MSDIGAAISNDRTSEGFETIDPNAYAPLHDPMKLLGLRPADMLRKP
jgi:hypothetical protein